MVKMVGTCAEFRQADKFLLAARSEYFERMLRTGMSEVCGDVRSEHTGLFGGTKGRRTVLVF